MLEWNYFKREKMINLQYMIINNLKDEEIALHYHASYELTYYFSGTGYCEYQNTPIERAAFNEIETTHYIPPSIAQNVTSKICFEKGSVIIFPPYVAHRKKHTENSRFLSLVFDIHDSALLPDQIHYKNATGKTSFLLSEIENEYLAKKNNYMKMVECLLAEVCIELNRNDVTYKDIQGFITQTIHFLDDYFLNQIDLKHYCQSNGYSLDYFRHKFKNATGLSPKSYVMRHRMNYAKSLLQYTDMPIHEISELCRFSDYTHFTAYFTSKFGMSPTRFRQLNRK